MKLFLRLLIVCSVYLRLGSCDLKFPPDFKFGVSSSAYQIEGAWNEDGKGVNIFDNLFHATPQLVADQSNGDIACDSYHKYEEDVQLIKNIGIKYYRFSISWTRILPNGFSNQLNQAGVDYYNNLINNLLANGIQPAVTIYHWDTPYMFNYFGTWSNRLLVDYFGDYARLLFKLYGDRVRLWFTFNEAEAICAEFPNFLASVLSPYPLGVTEYECGRTVLLSHARAYHIYEKEFRKRQGGKISIVLNFNWYEAASNSWADRQAAETRRQFQFGWFANPIIRGNYPSVMISRVAQRSLLEGYARTRLPPFTLDELLYIYGTYDFLGINHYTTSLIQASPEVPIGQSSFANDMGGTAFQDPSWPASEIDPFFRVVPWGLRSLLKWVKDTYGNPDIYITESGYPDAGQLEDPNRVNYYRGYLNQSLYSIHVDRVKLRGYFAWSIMDNFEWFAGYTVKYGLYQVNFNSTDRTRTAKQSAEYYKSVIQTRMV